MGFFSYNSFWKGVASIFDFLGVLNTSRDILNKSDSEAIKDDWKKIIEWNEMEERE